MIDLTGYDFVDFGCSKGGSIDFAMKFFGGKGIGIDIDPVKVSKAIANGYNAIQSDVGDLDPQKVGQTGFVILSHFLEHLPTHALASKCIRSACGIARDFVLIQQPYFDADPYLFNNGLKVYWSDWDGHSLPMTTLQLYRIIQPLLHGPATRLMICGRYRITSSLSPDIHSLASESEQVKWKEGQHPPKPTIHFTFPVFKETCAIIFTGMTHPSAEIQKYLSRCEVIWDSDLP